MCVLVCVCCQKNIERHGSEGLIEKEKRGEHLIDAIVNKCFDSADQRYDITLYTAPRTCVPSVYV